MAASKLTSLPTELLILTLSHLDTLSIFRCMLTCRLLNTTLSSSPYLRYLTQLQISGMWNNPSQQCGITIHDRLRMLKKRERAWRTFDCHWVSSLEVPGSGHDGAEKWSGVYDLTPSVYLLGRAKDRVGDERDVTQAIQGLRMPWGEAPTEVEWNEFNFGMQIIDFGTAIEEHDLLACVSYFQEENNSALNHFVVVLLRFSTKRTHDACDRSVISICCAPVSQGIPSVSIEIVGENLAVLCIFPEEGEGDQDILPQDDRLYIFDWQMGKLKGGSLPVRNAGLTFLREDIVLNPNIDRGSLDVYHIPPSSDSLVNSRPTLVHSLLLPPLLPNRQIIRISCRADPNPTSGGLFPKYTRKERPFAHNPEDAITIFTLAIQQLDEDGTEGSWKHFVMLVHRRALLEIVEDSIPRYPGTSKHTRVSPYTSWGPNITRWFAENDFSTGFITTTSGQRCVQYVSGSRNRRRGAAGESDGFEAMQGGEGELDPPREPDTIEILDFNPWHVKLGRHMGGLVGVGDWLFGVVGGRNLLTPTSSMDEHPSNVLPRNNTFKNPVVGRLPYLVSASEEKWDYDAVLLDEERVVGVRNQPDAYSNGTIDILYFG
ncbi:hypothetical protein CPB83DRAFT_897597 [Crepidotus variabilis]|uniref:F-box domain-containing protein n=1 Tax=Crepidotus variabilis TaxID=179855 RepID=A0A9P6E8R6_9AGAR|nr:hypothetical protein CPB83DRAFT_897597 [Crepidotus variabilis]